MPTEERKIVRLDGASIPICVIHQLSGGPHTLRALLRAGREAGLKSCRGHKDLATAIRSAYPQDTKEDWGECLLIMRDQMTRDSTGRWALETVHNDGKQAYTPGFWPIASLDAAIPVGFKLVFEC